jgi:hypothetical protein
MHNFSCIVVLRQKYTEAAYRCKNRYFNMYTTDGDENGPALAAVPPAYSSFYTVALAKSPALGTEIILDGVVVGIVP